MSLVDSVDRALEGLRDLHGEIDDRAGVLSEVHAARLQCRKGCAACCLDQLTVTQVEAERIRRAHSSLLKTGEPRQVGACAFLDENDACRIYDDRPSVCRSQGLPLRFLFENEEEEIEEQRDICSLNVGAGPPLDSLPEEDCWLLGPFELRLIALEEQAFGADAERVSLRSLFSDQD